MSTNFLYSLDEYITNCSDSRTVKLLDMDKKRKFNEYLLKISMEKHAKKKREKTEA